ncbi:MAG: MarR family transcriptional regulator [Microbacteriaceae bacterium]
MGLDAEQEHELRILIQRVSRRIRVERGANVSDSQLGVLGHLHREGPTTPGELAALERVSPPSMNRTINALAEAGRVRRDPSPDDARKVLVSITEGGEELILETKRLRSAWFHARLDELGADDLDALAAVLPVLRRLADS